MREIIHLVFNYLKINLILKKVFFMIKVMNIGITQIECIHRKIIVLFLTFRVINKIKIKKVKKDFRYTDGIWP